MIHFRSDRSNQPIPGDEVSALRLDGPLKHMLGRSIVHVTKAEAKALSAWFGVVVVRPELEDVPGPEAVTPSDYLADARRPDATAADLAALRVQALANGTPAGTSPPKPRPRATRPRKPA